MDLAFLQLRGDCKRKVLNREIGADLTDHKYRFAQSEIAAETIRDCLEKFANCSEPTATAAIPRVLLTALHATGNSSSI